MRRPIAMIFVAFAGGIWLNFYLPFIIIVIFLSMVIVGVLVLKKPIICVFMCLILIGSSYFEWIDSYRSPLCECQERVVMVKCRIESIEETERCYRLIVRATDWACEEKGGKLKEKILVMLDGDLSDINFDREIKYPYSIVGKDAYFKGKISLPKGSRNPGIFDYKLYLRTKKIQVIAKGYLSHLTLEEKGNIIAGALAKEKYKFATALDETMSKEAKALLLGMLFGDKTLLNEDLYETFRKNGTAHILAVSGIHVGVIYLYIYRIFRIIFRSKINICSSIIGIVLLFTYASLSSFSPSVVRAVIMIVIHIISKHLFCRYDLLSCASLTALIMLIWNPYQLFNVGFQLSFLAIFSLVFLLPISNSKIENLSQYKGYQRLVNFLRIMIPVVVIQIGLIPAIAFLFQYISFSAFVLNLPIISLAGFIIPLGMTLNIFSIIGIEGKIFGFLSTGIEILIELMIKMNAVVGCSSLSSINITSPSSRVLFIFYGIMFLCSSEYFWIYVRKRRFKQVAIIATLIVVVALCLPFITDEIGKKASIVFVDVGQGDCIHIRTPLGQNILVDGGGARDYDVGKNILLPYLLKNGVSKIDLALITHLHDDHYKGIASLCNLMSVEKLGLYEANILRQEEILAETGLEKEDLLFLTKGHKIILEEEVWIEILYPEVQSQDRYEEMISDEADENHSSLLIKIYYKDISVLLTGDLGFEGEDALMEIYSKESPNLLKSDILKVGHHGSRYSTGDSFLEIVHPKVAVIQVGENNFGHPHPDTIEKLKNKDIMIFRNDTRGAVLLDIKNDGTYRIKTMLTNEF